MVHLLKELDILKQRLIGGHVMFFLDYDGTLAPIAETPDKAIMTQEMRKVIIGLSKLSKCHLTVISGRKLSDLKNMIDIPNVTYIGNHGFEIEGPTNINFKSLVSAKYTQDLMAIKYLLTTRLSAIKGVWIEDKGIILTVHFRLATKKEGILVKEIFMDVCKNYLAKQRINITKGRKVLEIRPPVRWDKGEAALWILSKWQYQVGQEQSLTIYVGDDFTDEDAFVAIKDIGITVYVGVQKPSHAQYYLNSTDEVVQFLRYLYEVKHNE